MFICIGKNNQHRNKCQGDTYVEFCANTNDNVCKLIIKKCPAYKVI